MKLALVMIVRDEARCLQRCLESAGPFVDEMIVLDTGSTDNTVAIAQAAGAQVGHFTWCDDFAAARNAALDLSDADWNLIVDADETLAAAPALRDRANLARPDFLGAVTVESIIEAGGERSASSSIIPRLLPRDVRYAGRIHEQPVSVLPIRALDITLAHDGYLPEQRARKGDRNEVLLLQSIEATPEDGYLWRQLGREYDATERYDAALIAFTEALRLSNGAEPWRHGLVVRAINTMTHAGALDQALALAQVEDARWSASPDFHFALGALFLECASADQANAIGQWLPWAEARWRRCLEIGEAPHLPGSVRGRGSHMAAHNLAALYATFGPAAEAARYEALAIKLKAAA